MTKINIGTNIGNFVGVEIDKPFSEITAKDIYKVLLEKTKEPFVVRGWTLNQKNKNENS